MQVLNYSAPPHCTRLRDLDLILVQYVAASLSPSPLDLLLTLLHRFRLYGWAMRACAPSDAAAAASAARVSADYSDEGRALALGQLEAMVHCDDSQRMRLVAEALQLILQIATELPPPPADPADRADPAAAPPPSAASAPPSALSLWDPARAILRRELIHRLAQSPASRSEAARVVELVPRPADAKRMGEVFDAILVEVAVRAPGGGSSAGAAEAAADGGRQNGGPKWRLKDELWAEVDPEHCHTALHFLRVAAGAGGGIAAGGGHGPTRGRPSPASSTAVPCDAADFSWGVPLVGPPPPAHPFFARARRVLHEPVLACLVRAALATGNTDEVLSRSVQIITLAVHTLDDLHTPDDPVTHDEPPPFRSTTGRADAPSGGVDPGLGERRAAASAAASAAAARRSRFLRSLCSPAPSADALRVLPPTASTAAATRRLMPALPADRYTEAAATGAASEEFVLRAIQRMLHPPPPPEPPEPSPESLQSAAATNAAGAGTLRSSVIGLLYRLASGGGAAGGGAAAERGDAAASHEETLRSGCAWLLNALAVRDAGCSATLSSVAEAAAKAEARATAAASGAVVCGEPTDAKAAGAAAAERRARKMAAQQRALAQMAKQAESFAALIADGESGRGGPSLPPAVSRDASVAVALPEDVSSAHLPAASPAVMAGGALGAEAEAAVAGVRAEDETAPEPLMCIICHVTDADSDDPLGCIGFVQPSAALRCAREPRLSSALHSADGCSRAASAAAVARAASARAAVVAGEAEARFGGAGGSPGGEPDDREEAPYMDGQLEGRRELYAALCGHAVHFDCFKTHTEALRERAERGVHFEGRSAIDLDR